MGFERDTALILSRSLNRNGKSESRINGRLCAAGMLKGLTALLVDIFGQSEHLGLLKPENSSENYRRLCPCGKHKGKARVCLRGIQGNGKRAGKIRRKRRAEGKDSGYTFISDKRNRISRGLTRKRKRAFLKRKKKLLNFEKNFFCRGRRACRAGRRERSFGTHCGGGAVLCGYFVAGRGLCRCF